MEGTLRYAITIDGARRGSDRREQPAASSTNDRREPVTKRGLEVAPVCERRETIEVLFARHTWLIVDPSGDERPSRSPDDRRSCRRHPVRELLETFERGVNKWPSGRAPRSDHKCNGDFIHRKSLRGSAHGAKLWHTTPPDQRAWIIDRRVSADGWILLHPLDESDVGRECTPLESANRRRKELVGLHCGQRKGLHDVDGKMWVGQVEQ